MAMSALKIALLKQELKSIGFPNAEYIAASDKVKMCPVNDSMPFIDDEGSVFYGSENEKIVREQILPLVSKVNEVTTAWETSSYLTLEGLSNYKKLTEYNGIMLAARDDGERGLHFVTWECSKDRTGVAFGHYTSDYEKAKEDFAKRAGLISENKVFTSEQAKEIHYALIYRGKNDDELSYKGDEIIKDIVEKLESGYSDSSQMSVNSHLPDAEVEL